MPNPAPASQDALGAIPAACEEWVNVAASSPDSKESEVRASLRQLISFRSLLAGSSEAGRFCRLQTGDVDDLEDPSEDTVVQVRQCNRAPVAKQRTATWLTKCVVAV